MWSKSEEVKRGGVQVVDVEFIHGCGDSEVVGRTVIACRPWTPPPAIHIEKPVAL